MQPILYCILDASGRPVGEPQATFDPAWMTGRIIPQVLVDSVYSPAYEAMLEHADVMSAELYRALSQNGAHEALDGLFMDAFLRRCLQEREAHLDPLMKAAPWAMDSTTGEIYPREREYSGGESENSARERQAC